MSSHLVDWIWQEHSVHHYACSQGQLHPHPDHFWTSAAVTTTVTTTTTTVQSWPGASDSPNLKLKLKMHHAEGSPGYVLPPCRSDLAGTQCSSLHLFPRAASPASRSLLGQCRCDDDGLDHNHSHDDNDDGSILVMTPQRHRPQRPIHLRRRCPAGTRCLSLRQFLRAASPASRSLLGQCCRDNDGLNHSRHACDHSPHCVRDCYDLTNFLTYALLYPCHSFMTHFLNDTSPLYFS